MGVAVVAVAAGPLSTALVQEIFAQQILVRIGVATIIQVTDVEMEGSMITA